MFSRTTRDYPATTSFESGELGAFRSYCFYSVSSLASASNALSVPGALISETPSGADDEFATSSRSAAAGIVTCGAPAKPEAHVSLSCDARNASTSPVADARGIGGPGAEGKTTTAPSRA